jgi:hypothetical protein
MSKHSSMTILSDVELDAVTGAGDGQSQTNNSQTNQSNSVNGPVSGTVNQTNNSQTNQSNTINFGHYWPF